MTQDTSTETMERLAKHHDLLHPKVETVTLFAKTSEETAEVLRAIAAERDQALARERALLDSNQEARDFIRERDTLTKQVEDCARTCAEQAEEIQTLTGQLAEARGTLDRIDVIAEVADAAPLCMGEIRELIKMNRALKSEPAPRQSVQEAAKVLASDAGAVDYIAHHSACSGASLLNALRILSGLVIYDPEQEAQGDE